MDTTKYNLVLGGGINFTLVASTSYMIIQSYTLRSLKIKCGLYLLENNVEI